MSDTNAWDWDTGDREITDINLWREKFEWVEEPQASPDGEQLAAVVKTGEMEFNVCINGTTWENTYDKIWYLRFTPDNRPAAIVSDTSSLDFHQQNAKVGMGQQKVGLAVAGAAPGVAYLPPDGVKDHIVVGQLALPGFKEPDFRLTGCIQMGLIGYHTCHSTPRESI